MFTSPSNLACSGPGAQGAIDLNIRLSYLCAATVGIRLIVLAYRAVKNKRAGFALPAAAAILAIHPAWTVSAFGGDCGMIKLLTSLGFTLVTVMLYRGSR